MTTTKSLAKARKDKSKTREELEKAIEKQDAILRKTGGTFYPNRSWSENVEMFLVGAFLVIGIRTFFSTIYHSYQLNVSHLQRDDL